ncbi:MAG: hypothetical protein JSU05_00330 [Bacteroidetes bacterium]|nr:hypothetical protein [Bacteroidota bacterium]
MQQKLLFLAWAVFMISPERSLAQCSFTITTTLTNVSCYNGTNGSIVVNVTGGTAPYQYQLAEAGAGAWQGSNTFSALTASTYPVSVKDATGCVKTIYVNITQPAALSAAYVETDATCTGSNNGTISITTTGGTSPYTYNWTKNGSAYSTSQNLSGLAPGNYLLTVTDAKGCSTSPIVTSQVKPISLTGFNQDVVANGTGAATSSTTQPLDDHSYVFYASGYNNGTTSGPHGLPATGSFTSTQDAARSYQLASYTASNSLVLTTTPTSYGSVNSGTLSFTSQYQSPYATLYVIGTTGNGTGTVNYTVNYSDATTSTGSISFPDWFLAASTSSSIRALGSLDRVSWASPGTFDNATNFNIYEAPISIPGASQSKVINSVSFAWSASGTARINLFGITGYTSTTSGIRVNDGASTTVTPSVSVTTDAPSNKFCAGQSVTFTAHPVNGGTSPTYQWKKNGTNIGGATSASYTTSTISNGDQFTVVLTSSLSCVSSSTGTSPAVTMSLGTVPASVTISASSSSICSGTAVDFTASPVNGGSSPGYQWKLNGSSIPGATSATFSSGSLNNGDQVSTVLTSGIGCATGSPATSNTVAMTVTASGEPSISISSVPNVTFSSTATFAGSSPAYQWYKNGTSIPGATSSSYYTASAGLGNVYSLKLTSNYACKTAPSAMSNYITVNYATLPLNWDWFTATVDRQQADLAWKTASESGLRGFQVQRALPGSDFVTIGQVAARNEPLGASYQFTDLPGTSGEIRYRLLATGLDGHENYSPTRSIRIPTGKNYAILNQNSSWQLTSQQPLRFTLRNDLGQILQQGTLNSGSLQIMKPTGGTLFFLVIRQGGIDHTEPLLR